MILDNDIKIQEEILPITPEILLSNPNFKKHNSGTWTYWTYVTKSNIKIMFRLSYAYDLDKDFWYAAVDLPLYKTLKVVSLDKLINACECAAEMYYLSIKMESDYTISTEKERVRILNEYHFE